MLEVIGLKKKYKSKKGGETEALKGIDLKFGDTGLVFILGKSGCGKSTFLNLLGGLDRFDGGEIIVNGKSSKDFSGSDFDSYRNTYLGFVFQEFNIIESFSIEKNIALALQLQHKKEDKQAIQDILQKVELENFGKRKPNELSGGQKQRVAIARALVKNPEIILADEPTGALDSATGKAVLKTLQELSREKLVIIVSHDREFAEEYADRIVELKDGLVISDRTRVKLSSGEEILQEIVSIDKNIIRIPKGKILDENAISELNIQLLASKQDVFLLLANKEETANAFPEKMQEIEEKGLATRSAFVKTDSEKIESKKQAINLIKSRLPLGDALGIGASNFKAKKMRLVFTVLLSIISLCFFGLSDMFASYDKAETYTRAFISGNAHYMSVEKTYSENGYDEPIPFVASDVQTLIDHFGDQALKVYSDGIYVNLQFAKSSSDMFFSPRSLDGFMETKYNQDLIAYGEFPTEMDEIMISDYYANALVELGLITEGYAGNVEMVFSDYQQILGTKITVSGNSYDGSNDKKYKIVGIFKTNYHFYEKELEGKTKEDVMTDENVKLLSSNLQDDANMFYNKMIVAQGFGETLKKTTTSYNAGLFFEIGDVGNYHSMYNSLSITMDTSGKLGRGEVLLPYEYYKLAKYDYDAQKSKAELDADFYSPQQLDAFIRAIEWNSESPKIYQTTFNVVGLCGEYYDQNGNISVSDGANEIYASDNMIGGIYSGNQVIMNEEDYWDLMDVIYNPSSVMINARMDGDELYGVIETLDDMGFTVSARNKYELRFASQTMSVLMKAFYIAAGVLALFVILLMYNFISTSIVNKQKEIGILRAIGARGVDIMMIFLFESLLLGAIILAISIPSVMVVSSVLNNLLLEALPISIVTFKLRQVFTMTGITLLIISIASFLPVYKISRKKPIDAILNK